VSITCLNAVCQEPEAGGRKSDLFLIDAAEQSQATGYTNIMLLPE